MNWYRLYEATFNGGCTTRMVQSWDMVGAINSAGSCSVFKVELVGPVDVAQPTP